MKKLIIKKPQKRKISPKVIFYSFLITALLTIWLGSYTVSKETKNISGKSIPQNDKSVTTPVYNPNNETESRNTPEDDMINDIQKTFEDIPDKKASDITQHIAEEKQYTTYISLPLKGEIIKPFSDTELIYSNTMADYRTHSGIDISSNIGDTVYSPQNGKILSISKDEYLGYTITIDHGNMISKISNLSSKIDLKAGEKVNMGQEIAVCGDSAEYEIADEPHIHYELIVNGVNVNPLDYTE